MTSEVIDLTIVNIISYSTEQVLAMETQFRTPSIRICQLDYTGQNDTMGLVVARTKRRLISNLSTGTQFLGRESNSHYHLRLSCLKTANGFVGYDEMIIPDDIISCIKVFANIL